MVSMRCAVMNHIMVSVGRVMATINARHIHAARRAKHSAHANRDHDSQQQERMMAASHHKDRLGARACCSNTD